MAATNEGTSTNGRRVVANISLSIDGRTNGAGGDFDMGWIVPHAVTDEALDHMVSVTGAATTALLGRKNYEGFGGYWPTVAANEAADPREREFSRWLDAVEKVVFTSTLEEATWPNARLVNGDPADVVAGLRGQPGGDIIVLASSSVIRALLAVDAIDRLSITLCPEVVGGGARLFEDGISATSWALTSSVPTSSGALCLVYDRTR